MSKKSRKPREILHSKRGNLEYLEYCRVLVKGGRVLYLLAEAKLKHDRFWNIPIANTTALLLGPGTSITQNAVRMLAEAGVLIGFAGTGGTPLIAGSDVEWLTPQSEYRPTEYLQGWMKFWFDDEKRLHVAKDLQKRRLSFLVKVWNKDARLAKAGISGNAAEVSDAIAAFRQTIDSADAVTQLLAAEGRFAKSLYKYAANATGQAGFVRDPNQTDAANRFLSHGNYLAYGCGAVCLWCLGIPHGFAVMHGKTRRGALVFDVADLVKDALILPLAFVAASEGLDQQEFREECLDSLTNHQALDFMFDTIKRVALSEGECP